MIEGFLKVEMIQIKTKSKFKTIQRRLQSNPDNGYGVGHAEGRRRGQDDDLNCGHDDVQDVGADVGDSGWIHE